ncbi:MAG: AI-2E family transporter [Deltaproteobacteria bacterium]|nr:AI-2E family transporter [Deltaproteobacteria bacterium]
MSAMKEGTDTLQFIRRLPWEKMLIWLVFFLCIYLLRSFFGILFITFVISYITSNIVRRICLKINIPSTGRRLRQLVTLIVFLLFLSLMSGVGSYIFPRIVDQVRGFVTSVQVLLPPPVRKALYGNEPTFPGTHHKPAEPTLIDYAENLMENILGEDRFAELKGSAEYQAVLNKIIEKLKHWIVESSPEIVKQIPLIVLFLFKGISDLLISILFSFIIVLQLPSLQTGFFRLQKSRLSRFYEEIVPDIIGFGKSIGRAFQAQALIAVCNTVLTFLGLIFFDVPSSLFLSLIVFICSFIPVMGLFLSSLPICILGLQAGGFFLVLKLTLFIIGIHLIEAYLLNPKIMGSVMKVHFLAVLIILLVAGKLFGFWGLLLGIPTFQYIYNEIILDPDKQ